MVRNLIAVEDGTAVLVALVDAKGDIIAATAADTVARLAVGADGLVLKAASGQATGLQWAAETAHPNLATHDSLGLATDAELTTHAGAADPHTGYVLESLLDAKGDLIAASADNTPAKLTAGGNGRVLTAQSGQAAGLAWANGPSMSKFARRTAGNVVVNFTSWTNLDTATDLVLPAATGDNIEVAVNCMWNNEGSQSGLIDAATIVSAAPVNYFSSGTGTPIGDGVIAWQADPGFYGFVGAPIMYTLQAGDISAGTVTLRVRVKNPVGGTKTLFASTGIPFYWQAKNLGPSA